MIELRGVSKFYSSGDLPFAALQNVDLRIRTEEFVAIMGPSGSGKSTLLHLIAGLDVPDQGEITVNGVNLKGLSENERTLFRRRHIGFVFQNFQLLPAMTVEENIAFPLHADGRPKAEKVSRVARLLKEVGLEDKAGEFPNKLSGGQQQRVAIARALALQPRLLLADEPTGNLDRKRSSEILQLLSNLHRQQKLTIVMVTHDPYTASFADRVIMLRDGEVDGETVSEEGSVDELLGHFLEKSDS
jgi:ABC-type lipoprotein export system ATPase subunit